MLKTFRIVITGKVQGVWYRASAKDRAIALGLTGKVWNEPNGDVGAIVQGEEDKVMQFVQWCKQGPPLAKVDEVTYEEIDYQQFSGFDISRNS
ncbi:MAG TPA: acylphosphatase [Saprospiraceae bacterium]|nr:acylphosphatase [Saprospiraceae bacterium]